MKKNFFGKLGARLRALIPTRRRLIQLYAALLFNANLKGYINGQIYKGPLKNLCTPGLNCYSCPGASTACPMGALQNALSESNRKAPYYMLGILLLYGIIFGRWICGFLCPFGLVQDLTYKIKTPKLKKSRVTRVLSYFKYVILAVFVIILPIMYSFRDFPLPAFCKYICPAGVVGGAFGLLSNPANEGMFEMLGPLFTWKFVLAVVFLAACVFVYRFFCRFFCPLGAIYGLFNRISLLGVKLDRKKCIDCGLCVGTCKMDIRHVGDHECISCGDCVSVCPTGAIRYAGGRPFLAENEIPARDATEEAKAEIQKKNQNSRRRARRNTAILAGGLAVVLAAALIYFNVFDKVPPPDDDVTEGTEVGDLCPSMMLPYIGEAGEFSLESNRGRVTVINFWGVWCAPCKAELPHFDAIATDYADRVTVVTVHSVYANSDPALYIADNYPDSHMLFVIDSAGGEGTADDDVYYQKLGGSGAWPMTVIVDAEGKILFTREGSVTHAELEAAVRSALGE